MKKLLTVVCLSGLLSVPSVVFAEASWYGSLRAGINAAGTTGVANGGSRWGIRGSSEVSEGLTAVYNFETNVDSTNATQPSGRLSYVGLSGGFGTLTIGQIWSASFNSVGAITDNSTFIGNSETSYRNGSSVSYAVSVENISIQVDAIMKNGSGTTGKAASAAVAGHGGRAEPVGGTSPDRLTLAHGAVPEGKATAEDKNVDQLELGVSMGLGESGKIAFAYIDHDAGTWDAAMESYSGPDPTDSVKMKSTWIAGEYAIGSMTAYLGVGRTKIEDSSKVGGKLTTRINEEPTLLNVDMAPHDDDGVKLLPYVEHKQTNSTTFAGVRGSVGDTGIGYVFQARSKKSKGTHGGRAYAAATANADAVPGIQSGADVPTNSSSPWFLGLSRSLGGGASVHFEHANSDDGEKSVSYLALKIDF